MKTKSKKILISPLNWGIGHASRIIPIINILLDNGHNVYVAANGKSYYFLKSHFPKLPFLYVPGAKVIYGKKQAFSLLFFLRLPLNILKIFYENFSLARIQKQHNFDLIISDNRFGLYSKKTKSVIISHQLNIFLPKRYSFFNGIANKINRYFINKYDKCLVPDLNINNGLTGKLSSINHPDSSVRIGLLSRFYNLKFEKCENQNIDFLFILSGPEPMRTGFENNVINKFKNTEYKIVILRGKTEFNKKYTYSSNITGFDNLSDDDFLKYLSNSKTIVCRSGYSTIMDLAFLRRKAVLIPTEGQTEQEYLAERLEKQWGFKVLSQKNFIEINPKQLVFPENWELLNIYDKNTEELLLKSLFD